MRQDDENVIVVVEGSGLRIVPKHRDIVFKLFQRLAGIEELRGTGIGLAICKTIVERHGVRIWVESASEHGSRFSFSIPRRLEK